MKTPVTQRSPCYSAVSALLMNPLPDRSNYSPLCHTHYLTPGSILHSFFRPDPLPSCELETESSRELRKLNNKQRQVSMFLLKFLIHSSLLSLFSLSLSSLYSLSQSSLFSLSPIPSFSSDQFFVLIKTSSFITFCFTNGTFFCILFHTMTFFF